MIAGRMGIGFLKEAVTGQVPAGLKRLSINELAELVLDDAGYSEPQNVETRIWRPSLPVILGSSPSEYNDRRDRRATFQAQIVSARSHGT
jgi:hypothetical protein